MIGIGEKIKILTRERGLRQEDVAAKLNMTVRNFSYYLTEDRYPSLDTLIKICQMLKTTPNDLLGFPNGTVGEIDEILLESVILLLESSDYKLTASNKAMAIAALYEIANDKADKTITHNELKLIMRLLKNGSAR